MWQGKGLTEYPCSGPPLVNHHGGSALGLTVRKSNIAASFGHCVSGLRRHIGSHEIEQLFNTFGQVVCQVPGKTKLSLFGLHEFRRLSEQHYSCGPLSVPVNLLKQDRDHMALGDSSSQTMGVSTEGYASSGSVALMLESELDDDMRVGAWMEMKRSNLKRVDWAVSLSDDCNDELGWGLSLSGTSEGQSRWDRFQFESFVKFNIGKKFNMRPGFVHVIDGNARLTAFMVRSNWSF